MTSQLLARFFPDHPSDASDRSPIVDAVAHLLHDSKKIKTSLFGVISATESRPRSSTVHPSFMNGSMTVHVSTSLRRE